MSLTRPMITRLGANKRTSRSLRWHCTPPLALQLKHSFAIYPGTQSLYHRKSRPRPRATASHGCPNFYFLFQTTLQPESCCPSFWIVLAAHLLLFGSCTGIYLERRFLVFHLLGLLSLVLRVASAPGGVSIIITIISLSRIQKLLQSCSPAPGTESVRSSIVRWYVLQVFIIFIFQSSRYAMPLSVCIFSSQRAVWRATRKLPLCWKLLPPR
jgi:hypothetical protein